MNGEEAVIRASEPGQRGSLLRLSPPLPASCGRAAGAPQPRRVIRSNRVKRLQTGGLPPCASEHFLLEAWPSVQNISWSPAQSSSCPERRGSVMLPPVDMWSLIAPLRICAISIQRQRQTGRERERGRGERESVRGGREVWCGVVKKEEVEWDEVTKAPEWGGANEKEGREKKDRKKKAARMGGIIIPEQETSLCCVSECESVCGDRQREWGRGGLCRLSDTQC